jgi:predicted RNA-binding Zn ribbon-like protein
MQEDLPVTDIAAALDNTDVLPAGKLCLEFANTADWHAAPEPEEQLTSYADLVRWSRQLGLVTAREAAALVAQAAAQPALADELYTWALELREAIYRIFAAIAHAAPPAPADLATLNEALPQAFNGPALAAAGDHFTWCYHTGSGLDRMLWPVLRSAALLLTSPDLDRVGQCADDRGCGYLFFDSSRNRSRRWCDMGSCGNRAKARRHQTRHRAAAPASP